MGKSVSGAVWLNEASLPAYDYWQFWRNVDDRDVGKFLRLFTDLPLDEIARLEALEGAEINEAKKVLANEATAMCRGAEAAERAAETAQRTFAEGHAGGDLPTVAVPPEGMTIVAILKELGFVASNNEARRKIAEGAVKVDGVAVTDPALAVQPAGGQVAIRLGAKRHGLAVSG
jgi:tyrosyl-tRNA synthetase